MKQKYILLFLFFSLSITKSFSQVCISLGCAANYGTQTADGTLPDTFGGPGDCYDLFPYKQVYWQFFYSPTGGDFTQTYSPTSFSDPLDLDYVVFDMGIFEPVSIDCPIDESSWTEVLCNYSATSGVQTGPGIDGTAPTIAGHYYAVAVIFYQDVDPTYTFTIGTPQIGGVDFTENNCPGILPVILSSFNAKADKCMVSLEWTAEAEINFKKYQVEYSHDGRNFESIATIAAQGASGINKYAFQHNHPQQGNIFYRLKMIDNNGKFEYSRIIALKLDCSRSAVLVYPNPVTDLLNINITNAHEQTTASLFDNNGKLIYTGVLSNGTNTINMNKLAKGVYLLKLNNGIEIQNMKIIK